MNSWRVFYLTLRSLMAHPLGSRQRVRVLGRWFRWQGASRLLRMPVVVPYVDNCVLVVSQGMAGATGNVYLGLHEFAEMGFVLHYLRPGDLFVDVGANIGAYTILASGVCLAESIAVEPVSSTFRSLSLNVRVNDIANRVTLVQAALGQNAGEIRITSGFDTMNHVVDARDNDLASEIVPMRTLDSLLMERRAALVKIDVEGFESFVLGGARNSLVDGRIDAVILEYNGLAARHDREDREAADCLLEAGFSPHSYDPFSHSLQVTELAASTSGNIIFLRSPSDAAQRVAVASRRRVLGEWV